MLQSAKVLKVYSFLTKVQKILKTLFLINLLRLIFLNNLLYTLKKRLFLELIFSLLF